MDIPSASPGAGSSKRSYSPILREMPEAKKAKAAPLSRPSALPNFAAPFEWPELVALVSEYNEYTHDVQRKIAGPSFGGDVEDITSSITRIGRALESEVCLPKADANRYYDAIPTPLPIIYHIRPGIMLSINTRTPNGNGRTLPNPEHNADYSNPQYDGPGPLYRRDQGFVWPLMRRPVPAHIHIPQPIEQIVECLALPEGVRYRLKKDVADHLLNPNSVFSKTRERLLPFLVSLSNVQVLAPRRGPFADFLTLSNPISIRSLLSQPEATPNGVALCIHHLNNRIEALFALNDLALLQALDACAILGGRDLPKYPPNVKLRGALTPSTHSEAVEQGHAGSFDVAVFIRRLERYGVPLWFQTHGKQYRLDAGPDGLAGRDLQQEADHQLQIRTHSASAKRKFIDLPLINSNLDGEGVNVDAPWLPDGIGRSSLEQAVGKLLGCKEYPPRICYSEFETVVQGVLGKVWSGAQYEGGRHNEEMQLTRAAPWKRIRDGLQDVTHLGARIATFQIPPAWRDPQAMVANADGYHEWRASNLPERPGLAEVVELASWHLLKVSDLSGSDDGMAMSLAEELSRKGGFGWRFITDKIQKKDGQGKTIPRSRFVLEILFKLYAQASQALESLRDRLKGPAILIEPCPENTDGAHEGSYTFLFDYEYIRHLFATPCTRMERAWLLEQAPSSNIPRPTSSNKAIRKVAQAKYSHQLKFKELFEYESLVPLTITMGRLSTPEAWGPLDEATLPIADLQDIAFGNLPSLFSAAQCQGIRRFALMLRACQKSATPLNVRILISSNPYHRDFLLHVAQIVKRNPKGAKYFWRPKGSRDDGRVRECLKLSRVGTVEIRIDSGVSSSDCKLPLADELENYWKKINDDLQNAIAKEGG